MLSQRHIVSQGLKSCKHISNSALTISERCSWECWRILTGMQGGAVLTQFEIKPLINTCTVLCSPKLPAEVAVWLSATVGLNVMKSFYFPPPIILLLYNYSSELGLALIAPSQTTCFHKQNSNDLSVKVSTFSHQGRWQLKVGFVFFNETQCFTLQISYLRVPKTHTGIWVVTAALPNWLPNL